MDPTQNNDSFGSLSSGGDNPVSGTGGVPSGIPNSGMPAGDGAANGVPAGIPNSGMPVGVGGANPGAAMVSGTDVTNPTMSATQPFPGQSATGVGQTNMFFGQANVSPGQANAIFSQANVNNGMPISSGAGDVVIGGGQKQNQKKVLLVGGLIALVVLIVVGLIVGIVFSGGSGSGGGGQAGQAGLKGDFNNYTNYVMFGEDSNDDVTVDQLSEFSVYFDNLLDDEAALTKYIVEANKKFDALKNSYPDDGENQFMLESLADFFQKYPDARIMTAKEMSDLLASGGRNEVVALIDRRFSTSDENISNDYLFYLNSARDFSVFQLDLAERAINAGCALIDTLDTNCYALTEEESQKNDEYLMNYLVFELPRHPLLQYSLQKNL